MNNGQIDKQDSHSKYRKIFLGLDQNRSGLVKVEDLSSTLHNMGNDVSMDEIQATLSKVTRAQDTQSIVFEEFVYLMAELKMEIVESDEIALVFQHLDRDGDGFICSDDLRDFLVSMGNNMSEKDVSDMIEEADNDGDGKVSYEDFLKVMSVQELKSVTPPSPSLKSTKQNSYEESSGFDELASDSQLMLPGSASEKDPGFRRPSFASGAKRRMSCFLFGTQGDDKYPSYFQRRPRSRSSCGNLTALSEYSDAAKAGRKRGSFGSTPSFLKDLFKKK